MNINEIQSLIKFVAKTGVSEVEIEKKDFKIVIKSENEKGDGETQIIQTPVVQAAPVMQAPPVVQAPPVQAAPTPAAPAADPAPAAPAAAEDNSNYIEIKAPMIGTFYRSSKPEAPAFVNVGDEIKEGQVICIVEAMKLFNEIESEVSGKIVKVLADDSSPIEYDQPLFLVDPA